MTRQRAEHEGNPLASLTKRIRVMRMRDETVAPDPPKIRGPRDMRAIQPCALLREPEKWERKRRTKRRKTALGRRAGERKSA